MNLGELRTRARDLTGVYSVDLVSDTLLTAWVNETYDKVARMYEWPWLGSKVALTTSTQVPAWDRREFDVILAYMTAVRILETQADDSNRAATYNGIVADMMQDMVAEFLTSRQNPNTPTNRGELRQYLRNIMQEYTDNYSDATLNQFLNEAYIELQRDKDWRWLEINYSTVLPAGQYLITLPTAPRRIIEVDIVDDNSTETVYPTPFVNDVDPNSDKFYYDIYNNGVMQIAPTPERDLTIRMRFTRGINNLPNDSSSCNFENNFAVIIVYRAAVKLATLAGDDKKRSIFLAEYTTMFNQMVSYYQNDHDITPIQLGGEATSTYKYLPWFRS